MEDRVAEHRDHQREEQAHLGLGAGGEIEMPEEEDEQQQGKNADQSEDDRGGPAEVEHSFQNTPRRPRAPKNASGVYSPSPCERWSLITRAISTSCARGTSRCRRLDRARSSSATTPRASATTTISSASA